MHFPAVSILCFAAAAWAAPAPDPTSSTAPKPTPGEDKRAESFNYVTCNGGQSFYSKQSIHDLRQTAYDDLADKSDPSNPVSLPWPFSTDMLTPKTNLPLKQLPPGDPSRLNDYYYMPVVPSKPASDIVVINRRGDYLGTYATPSGKDGSYSACTEINDGDPGWEIGVIISF